jgi:hypothetical protein
MSGLQVSETSFESFVYNEETNRESKRRLLHECCCNERLNSEVEGSIRLKYRETGTTKDRDESVKRREVTS